MEKTNSIINSLKRLERFGDENGKAIRKLKDATIEVSEKIVNSIPDPDMDLPLNYSIKKIGDKCYLSKDGYCLNYEKDLTAARCLSFASDLNYGFMDDLIHELIQYSDALKQAREDIKYNGGQFSEVC